jgi:hypothetical protein
MTPSKVEILWDLDRSKGCILATIQVEILKTSPQLQVSNISLQTIVHASIHMTHFLLVVNLTMIICDYHAMVRMGTLVAQTAVVVLVPISTVALGLTVLLGTAATATIKIPAINLVDSALGSHKPSSSFNASSHLSPHHTFQLSGT